MYVTPVEVSAPLKRHLEPKTPVLPLLVCDTQQCCTRCHLRAWCQPARLNEPHTVGGPALNALAFGRRQVRAGQILYREGQTLEYFFEVRSGNLKSSMGTEDGQERVTGFHMSGDLLGLDSVENRRHVSTVTALEDTELCTLSYGLLMTLAKGNVELQTTLMRLMGREIVRGLHLVVLMASMSAEARLARFLLNFSRKMSDRGFSPSEFHMRMTRADIGSYLGLTLETVSRSFSALQRLDILDVNQRHIRITNLEGLASRR